MNGQNKKCSGFCFALVMVCVFGICTEATVYFPTDDTFVDQINPNTIDGSLSVLVSRTYSGWQIDTLLKFDLSDIPADQTVVSAVLHLYYFANNDGNPVGDAMGVRRVLQDWEEETANWYNQPGVESSTTASAEVPASFGWMQWDVTSDVQAFAAGTSTNYGWQIRNDTPTYNVMTYFKSKEAETEYYSYLDVTFGSRCGQWGYPLGDFDKDCHVNLADLSIMAQNWLLSSEPNEPGAVIGENAFIGTGIAFDGEDTVGPARVLLLYDDLNADVVEPNDIILEYRGQSISSGSQLKSVIMTTDDLPLGQKVPVILQKGAQYIEARLKQEVVVNLVYGGWKKCINQKCVTIQTTGGKSSCACQEYNPDYCWSSITSANYYRSPYAKSAYADITTQCYNGGQYGENPYNTCIGTADVQIARVFAK
jgi:hypothetical protein